MPRGEQSPPKRWSLDFIVSGDVERSTGRIPLTDSEQAVMFLAEIAPQDRELVKQKLSEMISKAVDDLFSAPPQDATDSNA